MLSDHPSHVPAHLRPWHVNYPAYAPVDITPPELTAAGIAASVADGWAEPALTPTAVDWSARQAALVPFTVVDGQPRNPAGRTGRTGRDLGRWGENAAADAIVIIDTNDGRFLLLIRRGDCSRWALPGGMVEPGETSRLAGLRELHEETGVRGVAPIYTPAYVGYVADPRNTDQAWVCTTAWLYRQHDDRPLPRVQPGADAIEARWFPFTNRTRLVADIEAAGDQFYDAHGPLLTAASRRLGRPRTATAASSTEGETA
ncbi:NUDIX domain-containing protein [Actinoplanes friuliensis]|uniref:Nudix hydrolase domain-containing protein n=1 Tax=Actinoplanes friuliensis DSM 7358 TaxID=1246995 RepID=U5VS34_9ACTN|nr:NUDIX domain-containing protein [Actinoplanes friuliensis]AGZ39602.1 hypothetical protein AFR_06565 [Actinoplanes friuliensis DSM 7358]